MLWSIRNRGEICVRNYILLANERDECISHCRCSVQLQLLAHRFSFSITYAEISGHQESDGVQKDIL